MGNFRILIVFIFSNILGVLCFSNAVYAQTSNTKVVNINLSNLLGQVDNLYIILLGVLIIFSVVSIIIILSKNSSYEELDDNIVDSKRYLTDENTDVYNYLMDRFHKYESELSISEAEVKSYIETSQVFKKSIIEIYRVVNIIENARNNNDKELTYKELDGQCYQRIEEFGFKRIGNKWYYNNKSVKVV